VQRRGHGNPERFDFLRTGDDTAVVVGQYGDGFAFQVGTEYALAGAVEVIAVFEALITVQLFVHEVLRLKNECKIGIGFMPKIISSFLCVKYSKRNSTSLPSSISSSDSFFGGETDIY
jgi:hypothetical protein